jgi:hypothetical protein
MNRMIDPRKVQEALDRAAKSANRAGRFTLTARTLPLVESPAAKGESSSKRIRDRSSGDKRRAD